MQVSAVGDFRSQCGGQGEVSCLLQDAVVRRRGRVRADDNVFNWFDIADFG